MITAVRIKNLRSLADTGYISIKPITLLLGANSSGKSTFLRSFPLFTQSVSKNLRGPISWFDDSLVDFGDYDTALNKYAENDETIQFEYIIKFPFTERLWRHVLRSYDLRLIEGVEEIKFSFSLKNDAKGTYINSVSATINDINICISVPDRQGKVLFEVNDQVIETNQIVRWDERSYSNILPTFVFVRKDEDIMSRISIGRVMHDNIFDFVRKRSDKRLRNFGRVDDFVEGWINNKNEYLLWLKKYSPITSFRNYVCKWEPNSPEYLELFNMIALEKFLPLWDLFDTDLSMFYTGCSYIAPTRAEANRYYRTQGLQTSDIDPFGKNLPEFISSLTPKMAFSYNLYTKRVLGVNVKTKTEAGHQSIMVSNDNGEFNITDIGFGYSQILPVVTKIWYTSNYRSGRFNRRMLGSMREEIDNIILMEQPELHLHPAYQAKIADAFINSVKGNPESETTLRLIVETHSDTILNRIGRRVREGEISPDDVSIVLFDKGIEDKVTRIRQTTYNAKGQIMEWPYGFFDPLEE